MGLTEHLSGRKNAILKAWFDRILEGYPAETAKFLKGQKDSFQNPVGSTLLKETGAIFDKLLAGESGDEATGEFIDRIVRIRAIQDFDAAQAVGFIFQLKDVIRAELGEKLDSEGLWPELARLEREIDHLALSAFEIFCSCRQKVFEIRAQELENTYGRLLKRTGMFYEAQEVQETPDLDNG